MSFFQVNQSVNVVWSLKPDANPPVKADMDVIVIHPNGTATYTADGLTTFTAPTATTAGEAVYNYTPLFTGLHIIRLVIGTDASYNVVGEQKLYVVNVPSVVTAGFVHDSSRGPNVIPPPAPSWQNTNNSLLVSGQEPSGTVVRMVPDGSTIHYAGINDRIYEYDLGTNFDLSSAVYNAVSLNTAAQGDMTYFEWSGDGTFLWTCFTVQSGTFMRRYNAVTPFKLTGASYASIVVAGSKFNAQTWHYNFHFGDSGNKIYVSDEGAHDIYQYSLGTPYDPTGTVTYDSKLLALGTSPNNTLLRNFQWNSDGTELWCEQTSTFNGVTGYAILIYTASTAWDIGSCSLTSTFDLSAISSNAGGFFLANNDTHLVFKDNSPSATLREWKFQ